MSAAKSSQSTLVSLDLCRFHCFHWKTGSQFLELFQSEKEALHMLIENELRKEPWDEMFTDAKQKRKVVQRLVGNVGMRHTLKQMLFDVCGTRSRASRGCLFESLGYRMLLSRSSALTMEQMRRKKR